MSTLSNAGFPVSIYIEMEEIILIDRKIEIKVGEKRPELLI